jgi:hypothetical protein
VTRLKYQVVATFALTCAAMIAPCSLSGVAAADGAAPLGGGAGITVNGTPCTLTTIGHDRTGDLVGITAAHCGGPGSPVVAEGTDPHSPAGTVVSADSNLDYSVIKFNSAAVAPTSNFAGFAINGIGPDPAQGQQACTHGAASGDGCGKVGVQTIKAGVIGAGTPAWNPGDDGEPVTVDGQLVGLVFKGGTMFNAIELRPFGHIGISLFSAILNDVNAKGGPGAGFTPI